MVPAGGLSIAAISVLGGQVGAWPRTGFALAVLLAAFVASLAAAAPVAWRERRSSPWPGLELAGVAVAAVLAGLHLLEVAADLLGGRGAPPLMSVPAMVLAAAAAAVAGAETRRAPTVQRSRAAAAAIVGAACCVGALALGLTLGDRAMGQLTGLTIAATVGSAVAVAVGGGRASAAAGLVLGLLGALTFRGLAVTFASGNFRRVDQLFFAVHLAGLVLVVAAAGAATLARRRP